VDKKCTCVPILHPDIAGPIQKELLDLPEEDYGRYIASHIKKLVEENKIVANWISQYAMSTDKPMEVASCAVILYRLLESQAEANALAERLEG